MNHRSAKQDTPGQRDRGGVLKRETRIIDRRSFFAVAAAASAICGLPLVTQAADVDETSPATDPATLVRTPVNLTEDRRRDLYRVRIAVNVNGNVNLPDNPLASKKSSVQLPITSDAVFDYEERYRFPEGAEPIAAVTGVERFYHEAASESVLNKQTILAELRRDVRQTIVRRDALPEIIYSESDYLTHEELGLLRSPVSAVRLGDMLPTTPVKMGDSYEPSKDALAAMLNLSVVETSDVTCEIVEVTDQLAKLQFKGKVDGSIDGVPTLIRMAAKMTFDRQVDACTWLALAVHETRDIGKAEPGFDVSATIKMIRQPIDRVVGLPSAPTKLNLLKPVDAQQKLVSLRSDRLHFATLVDRRWRMMSDVPGRSVMRMIDHERSIAQCTLRPLVKLPEGKPWTLQAFERDVRQTLGKQLTQLLGGEESVSESGLRVLQIVAAGKTESVDLRYIMQHFSDDNGRRMMATFIMDAASYDKLAGSEVQFASNLRFLTPPAAKSQPAQDPAAAPEDAPSAAASKKTAASPGSPSDLQRTR